MDTKKRSAHKIFLLLVIVGLFAIIAQQSSFRLSAFAESETLTSNNFTNLVVFVRFDGEENFVDDLCDEIISVKQVTENNYSLANYNVRDYFYRVSNGNVKMQTLYLFDKQGGAIELARTRGYYSPKTSQNPDGYDASNKASRMLELKEDWASAISLAISSGCEITDIDGGVSYSLSELDKDENGLIDALTIIYGYSNDYTIENAGVLWDYQDFYNGLELFVNNKKITSGNYVQVTANYGELYKDADGVYFSNLKTLIHEMGHIFGLKDLYKKDLTSPVYFMSAMAKAIAPVPQNISAKEQEALGWLNAENVVQIGTAGTYTIKVMSGNDANNVVCYKLNIPSINKILYLEYRNFDEAYNKYDTQNKAILKASGDTFTSSTQLKSGLVCYLMNKNMRFPDNHSSTTCNYEVVGGGGTKNDSALAENESYDITSGLNVEVVGVEGGQLTFVVTGTDIEHVHSIVHVAKKSSTCTEYGNDEYWQCEVCEKCFDDENLTFEKNIIEFRIDKKPHTRKTFDEVPSTCQSEGVSAGEKCEVCGEIFSGFSVIQKIQHVTSDWIIDKNATETETGEKHKECINCHEVLETEIIDLITNENDKDDDENVSGKDDDIDDNEKGELPDDFEQTQDKQEDTKFKKKILIISLSVATFSLFGCAAVVVVKKRKTQI